MDPSHSLGSPASGLPLVHVTRSTSPAHFSPRFLLESFKPRRATEEEEYGRGGDAGDDEDGDESTKRRNPRQARPRAPARAYARLLSSPRAGVSSRPPGGPGECVSGEGSASRRRELDGGTGEGRGGADRRRLPRPPASRCGDRRVRVRARISYRSSRRFVRDPSRLNH